MLSEVMPRLHGAGETHRGCVRTNNEDNLLYVSLFGDYVFAAVADGVGGHVSGDVASYLCCHRLLLDWKELFCRKSAPENAELADFLAKTIMRANSDIKAANDDCKSYVQMCTTLAAAVFTPTMVIAAHVGDSRLYCVRNKVCNQLTIDHTLLNEFYEKGGCDGEAPGAHVISKALGTQKRIRPEIHTYFRMPEDRYLLCSDGLTNCWKTQEIGEVISGCKTPRQANDIFIRNTLRRGALDNVTVVSLFPEQLQ